MRDEKLVNAKIWEAELIACCIDAMFLLLEVGTRNSLTNNSK